MAASITAPKVVLITGAAGSVGQGLCRKFYEEGFRVIGTDRNPISQEFCHHTIQRDLYKNGTAGLIAKAKDTYDRLDVLINNAGKTHIEWLENYSMSDFDEVMKINVYVPFELTQQLINANKFEEYHTRIINVSSMGARYGLRACTPYSTSKAGLVAMTKQMAREIADRYPNFSLFCVSPNTIGNTNMIQYCAEKLVSVRGFKDMDAAWKYICQSPIGRLETVEEVVESIYWLATNAPHYLTGTNLEHLGGAQ